MSEVVVFFAIFSRSRYFFWGVASSLQTAPVYPVRCMYSWILPWSGKMMSVFGSARYVESVSKNAQISNGKMRELSGFSVVLSLEIEIGMIHSFFSYRSTSHAGRNSDRLWCMGKKYSRASSWLTAIWYSGTIGAFATTRPIDFTLFIGMSGFSVISHITPYPSFFPYGILTIPPLQICDHHTSSAQ